MPATPQSVQLRGTASYIGTTDGKVNAAIPELLEELAALHGEVPPGADAAWPFLLSAGERRSFTANTIIRDPQWRKRDGEGALRLSPVDAERLGLVDGARATITTRRGSAVASIEVDDAMQPGHASIPNGLGLDHVDVGAARPGVRPPRWRAGRPSPTSPCWRCRDRGPARNPR